jgi:hypothetical protein
MERAKLQILALVSAGICLVRGFIVPSAWRGTPLKQKTSFFEKFILELNQPEHC